MHDKYNALFQLFKKGNKTLTKISVGYFDQFEQNMYDTDIEIPQYFVKRCK